MSSGAQDAVNGPDSEKLSKKATKRSTNKGNRPPRKRTKTGCLTCRKRRIKCGEERPTCFNCHKSRRECEGYRPPIVFRRSQVNSLQQEITPAPHLGYNNLLYPNFVTPYTSPTAQNDPSLISMAPGWPGATPGSSVESRQGLSSMFYDQVRSSAPPINSHVAFDAYSGPESIQQPLSLSNNGQWQLPGSRSEVNFQAQEQNSNTHIHNINLAASGGELLSFLNEGASGTHLPNQIPYREPAQSSYNIPQAAGTRGLNLSMMTEGNEDIMSSFAHLYGGGTRAQSEALNLGTSAVSIPLNDPSHQIRSGTLPLQEHSLQHPAIRPVSREESGFLGPSQVLEAAAVLNQDDDYWDLPSDEDEDEPVEDKTLLETEFLENTFDTVTTLTKSSLALAIHDFTSANTYTYPGFSLDEYRPEQTASPLRNPYTQRVFAHFVFSTGPLISYLQQRHRVAPSSNATIGKIQSSSQGLWTYTLATMALHNQGLLHAMLAMASLHMAKLQGASTTPSLKHYSYALRRIHRDVQHNRKRHEVSTLAATLLLAFFEIGQADHRKWSTHLVGARQLISEIDFPSMTAQIKYLKALREPEIGHSSRPSASKNTQQEAAYGSGEPHEASVEEIFPDLDERLLSKIVGRKYASNINIQIPSDPRQFALNDTLPAAELRNYQILQDLFWWNCRHDIIHALVGGNALLLDYERWNDCPPRANAGQPDAVHGTFDHFILLMGRLVNFMSNDRSRKIRVSSQTAKSKSPSNPSLTPSSAQTPGPGFYGMAPSAGTAPLPRAYQLPTPSEPSSADSPSTVQWPVSHDEAELRVATACALNEWNDIYTAFTALADSLGPAFQPLEDGDQGPVETPFGPAVLFQSHAIAALWAWYYAGLIIAIRSHPDMPAASTIACGAAASKTAKYANMVGRITYCITSDFLTPPLDPSSAGSFTESSLPLFFAGVQYHDSEQRRFTIARLREIENLTGWATIGLCANGCESAWTKAHEMGVGPEYVKSMGIQPGPGSIVLMEDVQEQILQEAIGTGGRSSKDTEMSKDTKTKTDPSARSKSTPSTASQTAEDKLLEHERRFVPFYRGTQVMWAYQLYAANPKDERDGLLRDYRESLVQ